MQKKVLLGMSGGVDSSVSAILLKKQGYEVIGATMRLWENDVISKVKNDKAIEDAKKVCEKLNINHIVFDLHEEFYDDVVKDFIEEYKMGRTPNPCIVCNKYIKFGNFFKKAKELGIDFVATGHYAKIEYSKEYNQNVIMKANEQRKDQTYFLYGIPKEKLDYIIFPLQNYNSKDEIRKIALENNLEVAEKKDSQEICFIDEKGYKHFLVKCGKIKPKEGNIILKNGKILGKHSGYVNYTIGQRKGLGVSFKEPLYVIGLNPLKNEVIVGKEQDLYADSLYVTNINWQVPNMEFEGKELFAKVRYRSKDAKCQIESIKKLENLENINYIGNIKSNKSEIIKIKFHEPQRAITPGQSIVFYDEKGVLLGGGKIEA